MVMPKVNCCVPFCTAETRGNPDLKFYRLPKAKDGSSLREKWIVLIRNKNLRVASPWTSVCSLHFKGGLKTYDVNTPTIFPWSEDWPQVIERYNNNRPLDCGLKFRRLQIPDPDSVPSSECPAGSNHADPVTPSCDSDETIDRDDDDGFQVKREKTEDSHDLQIVLQVPKLLSIIKMPARCIVAGCNNTTKDGVSLHKFPADTKSRRLWTAQVKLTRAKWSGPSDHSMICSAHFEAHCFHSASGFYNQFDLKIKPMLLQDAIPTIFPLTKKAAKRSDRQRGAFTKRGKIREQALGEDGPQFSSRRELNTRSSESRPDDQDDDKSEESMAEKMEESVSKGPNEVRPKTLKKDVCAAFGCSHKRSQNLCTLHSFPRDSEIKEKWIAASRCNLRKDGKLKKNFSSRNLRLCGCHFVRKPHPRSSVPRLKSIVPTLFNFPSDDLTTDDKPVKRIPSMPSPSSHEKPTLPKILTRPDFYQIMKHFVSREAYDAVDSCAPDFWNNYQQLEKEVVILRAKCSSPKVLSLKNIKGNDNVFEMYTGLPNYATFEALCGYLVQNAMNLQHTRAGIAFGELKITNTNNVKRQILTLEDQLFVFLVGVRTGTSNKDLAVRFSMSEALVSIIISSWAVFLSETLDEFYTTLAPAAAAASGRRITIKDAKTNVAVDYTALFSQSPALLTTQRDERNTNRRLIAVGFSSTGVVTSVLSTSRGHAFARVSTDKNSDDSASIQSPSKGHAVQEQGTPIATKAPKPVGVSTHIVSTDLSKSHMTLMSTQEVFHVKRALNRIKQFRYLQQQVSPSLVDTYERVFKTCAYLINFQSIS